VIGPEVEGAGFMPAVIRKCYTDTGVACNAFTSLEEAKHWVESKLA